MASTFLPSDLIDFAKVLIKNYNIDTIKYKLVQYALSQLWSAAPWGFTIGSLATVTVAADTEDLLIGSFPSDFYKLDDVRLHDTTAIDMSPVPLHIEPFLPSTVGAPWRGQPKLVAYYTSGGNNYYRIRPYFSSVTTDAYKLIGTYKKKVPLISVSNIGTSGATLVPDEWFFVLQELVMYWAYQFSDDPRYEKKLQYITKELLPYMMTKEALSLDSYKGVQETLRLS